MDKNIHQAAAAGDLDSVRVYIESRGDVNIQDAEGLTPLHQAGRNGHRNVVEKLLRSGAKIDKKTKVPEYLINIPSFIGQWEPMYVITRGVRLTFREDRWSGSSLKRFGQGPSWSAIVTVSQSASIKDALEQDCSLVKFQAKCPFVDIRIISTNGCTPLRTTCFHGHVDVVELLIESGADVNLPSEDGATPLFIAAQEGHLPVLEKLLSCGADINKSIKDGATPLYVAAQEGHLPVLEKLLSCGAEINKSREDGATPLFIAAQECHLPVLEKLLSCGADINKSMKTGATPLYIAAQEGRLPVLEKLLSCGAEINKSEEDGATPLHVAAQSGHFPVVEKLLSYGAHINKSTEFGNTPLHLAARSNHSVIVEELLLNGNEMDIQNKNGKTAKDVAGDVAKKVIEEYEVAMKKVPKEIRIIGKEAICKYLRALKKDAAVSNVIRVMLVGHFGVGKTTIAVNILDKKDKTTQSTEGIEVYINQCTIDIKSGKWYTKVQSGKSILGMSGYVRLDLVDFAGQFIFYTTHQAYLTSRGLYLLVFNLAMGLDGEVMDDDVHAEESIQRRVIDFLKFWISTIVTYARSEDSSFPKIILIGTHRDKVKDASQLLSIKSDIEAHFPQMIRSSQLIVREDLFISALPMTDKTKATIRGVILEQGMAYREFGEPIPRSWIALQEKLMKMKKKGRCIATKEEVMQMNRTLENPLDEEEMEIFLKYLHNIGYILHFPSPVLQEKIILDPIVVINAMKSFITCDSFIKSKRIRGIFDRMQRCGEVKISDICNMWKGKEVDNHSDHLLAVMQKLDIICEPTIYKGGQKISADFYVVPSMIKSIAPDGSVTNASAESQLVVVFSSLTILPPAIFHRLVCSCLALWTLFEGHIYHGFVALRVGRQHIMELRRHQNKIFITFSHAEATKKPDVHLCLTIKLFLSETIDRILKIYSSSSKDHLSCSSPGLDAELDTHCPSTSGNTDDRNTVCNCDEFSNSELNDVNLIRIAEHLQGIHLSTFCSVLLNNAGFESQIQHNYGSFNYDVKLFYVLQKWKKQGNSTVMRLRQLFENHLEHVNKHLICQAMRTMPCSDDALDPVVKLKQVYPEFLDATAQRISYKYIHLGLELGVPLSVIERLRLDKNSTLEIFRGILDHWHNARKGDATVLQLVTALNRCGETEISWINNEYETKRVIKREEETQPESAKSRCRVS